MPAPNSALSVPVLATLASWRPIPPVRFGVPGVLAVNPFRSGLASLAFWRLIPSSALASLARWRFSPSPSPRSRAQCPRDLLRQCPATVGDLHDVGGAGGAEPEMVEGFF